MYLGPTGSDVGRGNAAGYVNMTTKTPRLGTTYSGMASYGTAENKRLTADINAQVPMGEAGSWLAGSAVRLNALWQDGGVAGRDYTENERKAIAPSVALGLGSPTRVTVSGQFTWQDNLPDYGIPGAAWDEPLTPTSTLTTQPVDQALYYGSADVDYDEAEQYSVTGRIEHDFGRDWSVRNQTRYNETTRDAVITAIQTVASYVPATETVVFSRQANYRENQILANQTTLTGRLATGRGQPRAHRAVWNSSARTTRRRGWAGPGPGRPKASMPPIRSRRSTASRRRPTARPPTARPRPWPCRASTWSTSAACS